ncbi:hypothetical protein Bbelb_098720 [Branchiostoma belcheri]|nr:hypothetical protein Bbelb_098720 [Branchiostoma belcheri]
MAKRPLWRDLETSDGREYSVSLGLTEKLCVQHENGRHHMLTKTDNIHETYNTAKEDRDTGIVTLARMRDLGLPEAANNQMYLALSVHREYAPIRRALLETLPVSLKHKSPSVRETF